MIKKTFADDPLFANAKVIYSAHQDDFPQKLDTELINKLLGEEITEEDVKILQDPSYININRLAIQYADGIIKGSPQLNGELDEMINSSGLPVLEYHNEETYIEAYDEFYDKIIGNH